MGHRKSFKNIIKTSSTFWCNNKILHVIFLIFVSSVILFPNINNNPVNSWDEARHAVNALEMINSGDWVTLRFNNEPDMANIKFPLGAWLIAIDHKLFGINEISLRLWSAIFTILTTVFVYFLGNLIRSRWTGILAALVFITSVQVVVAHSGITGDYDAGASFFVTLSLFLFLLFYKTRKGNFWILSMVAIGLGIMYKSFVPGLIPLFIIFIFLLASEERKNINLKKLFFYAALIIIAIISPWLIARSLPDSSFLSKLLSFDYWQRLTSSVDGHGAPFWYYLLQMNQGFYPWLYFFLPGLIVVIASYFKNKDENTLLVLLWFLMTFLIFSVAETKNYWYMLPAFPAMAIIVSLFYTMFLETASKSKSGKILSACLIVFIVLIIAVAFFYVRSFFYKHQDRDHLSFVIKQKSIEKELLLSDMVVVSSNLGTQSNLFYLKRLLNDRFVFSSNIPCELNNKQLLLVKAETIFISKYLEVCPERKISERYHDYVLIK